MPGELRILHLEDEAADAELTEHALRRAGMAFSLRRVDSRATFIAALQEFNPDLILADYRLPAFDGLEALAIVVERAPEVPFIFVSGAMGEELAIDTLRQGAADYVLKGRLNKLVPAVNRALLDAEERRRRRQAEASLRESEERFRNMAEVAQDGIVVIDQDARVTYWNAAAERMFGYANGEIQGREMHALLAPARYHEAYRNGWAGFRQSGAGKVIGKTIEMDALHQDGREFPVELSISAAPIQGNWNAVGIIRDITERKRAEAEILRSNAELEQFSYTISHDMRQPLRMITSYLQLIERSLAGQFDAEQGEYFHFAIDGAKRLDAMLQGLLEYSRIGRLGEPPASVASRSILDDVLRFLQPASAEAGAEVCIDGEWPQILASPDEMLRLLQNLIGNALKFRVAGRTPRITVTSASNGKDWRVSIADNGIGILPDQIDRLFQVFQRLQSRVDYDGTGIGLALCRKIAEHHGGRIWAESAGTNQGCAFIFNLPVVAQDTPAAASGGRPDPDRQECPDSSSSSQPPPR
ncbi:MAG: PAS domain S-box protein [Sterolibacterium sp.]|jgi:PAS domain S-box-containing protein